MDYHTATVQRELDTVTGSVNYCDLSALVYAANKCSAAQPLSIKRHG